MMESGFFLVLPKGSKANASRYPSPKGVVRAANCNIHYVLSYLYNSSVLWRDYFL